VVDEEVVLIENCRVWPFFEKGPASEDDFSSLLAKLSIFEKTLLIDLKKPLIAGIISRSSKTNLIAASNATIAAYTQGS
jgi:hypothetical protein